MTDKWQLKPLETTIDKEAALHERSKDELGDGVCPTQSARSFIRDEPENIVLLDRRILSRDSAGLRGAGHAEAIAEVVLETPLDRAAGGGEPLYCCRRWRPRGRGRGGGARGARPRAGGRVRLGSPALRPAREPTRAVFSADQKPTARGPCLRGIGVDGPSVCAPGVKK